MTKISDLTALTGAGVDTAADLLPIVDMSAAGAARNKKITVDEARIGLGLGTAASPQFTGINLGHASDTTITRASAGVVAIEGVNVVTTAGGVTFAADIVVPDEAYDATAWNGSLEVPTKNAVRDKIESLGGGSVSDTAYGGSWDGDTTTAPSKNAVYDKIEAVVAGSASVSDTVYGAGWNGDTTVAPSKNAVYDKIEAVIAAGAAAPSAQYEDQKAANTAGGTSTAGVWFGRLLNTEVFDDIGLTLRSSTVTAPVASPGVVTWASHGLVDGSAIVFTTTVALPTGITAGTTYYVKSPAANTFNIAATPGGAAINFTGSESGTHTGSTGTISLSAGTYSIDASATYFTTNIARSRLRDITNGLTLALSENIYMTNANGGSGAPRILSRFTLAGTAIVQLEGRVSLGTATNGLGVLSNFGEVEVYSRLRLTKLS